MRIEKNYTEPVKGKREERQKKRMVKGSSESSFKEEFADTNQRERQKRLDKLLETIDEQGQKLKKTLEKSDLLEYKRRVKDFLRMIQREYARAKQSYSWDGRGNMRTFTIIETIDKNLEDLHNLFLEEQGDTLQVLKKIDEIRGLLMDLYI